MEIKPTYGEAQARVILRPFPPRLEAPKCDKEGDIKIEPGENGRIQE